MNEEVVDLFHEVIDAGLAASSGADPAAVIERYADRIDLVHCTDTNVDTSTGQHVSFGTGDVAYGPIFDAIEAADIEWCVYENGSTDAQREELRHATTTFLAST